MVQLIRGAKSWDEDFEIKRKRYPYAGFDELDNSWHEQVAPFTGLMCRTCSKRYQEKDFFKRAVILHKIGMCAFCGTHFSLPSYFLQVNLLLGKPSFKRIGRLDINENTKEARQQRLEEAKQYSKNLSYRF